MEIVKPAGCTNTIGAPSDWDQQVSECAPLPVREVDTLQGRFMVSAWKPTGAELAELMANGVIELWVAGTDHPVVAVTVAGVYE